MSYRKRFFIFIIQLIVLSGISQVVYAGSNPIGSVSASCQGDDVQLQLTGGTGWTSDISWTGGASPGNTTMSSPGGTHTIPGPGVFNITVHNLSYGTSGGFHYLGPITCPSPVEELIELCDDGRTNTNLCEPLAIYPVVSDDGTGIVIYRTTRDTGDAGIFAVYIPAEELDALLGEVEESCVIASSEDGIVVVYLLPTGEIQVNAGPDEEDKYFVYRYESFPSIPVIETYVGSGTLPTSPEC